MKWFLRLGLVLLLLALLLAAAILLWNQQSTSALTLLKAQMAREGESLDFRSYLSPALPPEENFCAIPLLDGLALPPDGTGTAGADAKRRREQITALLRRPADAPTISQPKLPMGATLGQPLDFGPVVASMRAKGDPAPADPVHELLTGFPAQEALFQELAAGVGRPRAQWRPALIAQPLPASPARWPRVTSSVSLPLVKALSPRGAALAQSGEAARAIESWQIMARLLEAEADEPFLINLLVASSMAIYLDGVPWELAWARGGTAEQWRLLEREYERMDVRAWALRCSRGERASTLAILEYARDHRGAEVPLLLFNDPTEFFGATLPRSMSSPTWQLTGEKLLGQALPGAVFEANAVSHSRMYTERIIVPLRQADWPGSLRQAQLLEADVAEIQNHPFRHRSEIMAANTLGSIGSIAWKLLHWQARVNLAAVACRLESYQREHGAWPDTLAGLTLSDGRPLPPDPINGKPLGYRRTPNGRYALWSVGFDGTDDAGSRGAPERKMSEPTYRGDWVWDFPAQ